MDTSHTIRNRLSSAAAELRRYAGALELPLGTRVDPGALGRVVPIRGLLVRSGKALQGALAASEVPDVRVAIQDYASALSSLRALLQTFEARLREERVRLQTEMRHVRATTSWAESVRLSR